MDNRKKKKRILHVEIHLKYFLNKYMKSAAFDFCSALVRQLQTLKNTAILRSYCIQNFR